MSIAEGALRPEVTEPAPADRPAPVADAIPRGRLFRKYALVFVALVASALLITSGVDFWFTYQESKAGLVRIQQEKAEAAAQRIQEFVEEIERQIGWTTHAQWAAGPLDQRRQDYFRLLRQVPAITELSQLDRQGLEQLRVSRLSMDVIGSAADLSQNSAFRQAKAQRVWFSPVYFRKESEPYLTLGIARDGRNAGVTVAEINLKLIWDVVTALRIGQSGYAYVIDGSGRLIAHPDISLVLRDTVLSGLPQVAGALAAPSGARERAQGVTVATNLAGQSVLTAHAAIAPLGWRVFVEVPLREAFAPLYGAAWRTALLLVFGLVAATLVALVLARRMTGPIRAIAAGAERIGRGELDRRIDIRTGDELEALAGQFNDMAADLQKSYAELEGKVEARTAELSESLDQQTATSEVLQVINSSPGDLAPVFDAMLEKAMRLCEAPAGYLLRYYDGEFALAAERGLSDDLAQYLTHMDQPLPAEANTRVLEGEPYLHSLDLKDDEAYRSGAPLRRATVDLGGLRTGLAVPLSKDNNVLGTFSLARYEVRPFTDKQIELVQNFAAQAVIAIENARLITETREALDQQTATAEVLQVINSSPGDLAPVFDAVLDKAMRLCEASFGYLGIYDGERFRTMATLGLPPDFAEYRKSNPQPGPGSTMARVLAGERVISVADLMADEVYRAGEPARRALVDLGGARSGLTVALAKENAVLGALMIYRQEMRPFTDKQIALVQNFAAQAVIAIENARLITETREALDQQTATAEVLQVINSSPGELAPVFDAMLDKAMRLCGAAFGMLRTYDGELFHLAAARGHPRFDERVRRLGPVSATPGTTNERIVRGEEVVQILDIADDEGYRRGDPGRRAMVEIGGFRTLLGVALRKDQTLLGTLHVYRQEVRPFTDKQIALLQNFAAQAVIAMENARLITETREALDQQTATAEVLQVINSSPGDLAPVFDAMLEKAMRLCGAAFGILSGFNGEGFPLLAAHGVPETYLPLARHRRPLPGMPLDRLTLGEAVVHIEDITAGDGYRSGNPREQVVIEQAGARTAVWVALRKDDALLGALTIYHTEVRPFTDKQIALLQNFAAQAVIAMENARLINETREALDQQTATAEVLQVINASPGDLVPVFDAMLDRAMRLCQASFGTLATHDGERFHTAATRGVPTAFAEFRSQNPPIYGPGTAPARLLEGERVVHIADLTEEDAYRAGEPNRRALADLGGARTSLNVPLLKDEAVLGFINIYRQEVRPFSDKQIALLQNFAAQAVIAMENARLITETREALDQQTATAEVLQVINSSPGDLAPVFDAMLEKAHNLCGVAYGSLELYDGENCRAVATHGFSQEFAALLRQGYRAADSPASRPLIEGARFVQIADAAQIDDPVFRSAAAREGIRTVLFVPLRKDAALLGMIASARREVRQFSDKETALLENFAAQAVIAIENARLLTETRERTRDLQESLEYQTATSDVLKVISGSVFDLGPVLQTVVSTAIRLCRADQAVIYRNIDGEYRWAAGDSLALEYERIEREIRIRPGAGTLVGRAALEARTVHIPDAWTDPLYEAKDDARVGGVHTMLGVPLLREGVPVGVIGLARRRVEPFTEREIELVATFADQAVIAIENARLLGELRERTDELARSVEELKVLGEVGQAVSSTLDLRSVLVTILNRSMALAEADAGVIFRYSRAERAFRFVEAVGWDEATVKEVRDLNVAEAVTALGEAVANRAPLQIADLRTRPSNPLRDSSLAAGYRSVLIVPLLGADRIMGVTILQRRAVGEFPAATVRLMQALASQSVMAIQNARLFREIAAKSEQLLQASQHKSQFLANMSHELRTPLNAILGYSELMADGIYGELPARAAGVLERVQNNGRHLLALINDVLDLAKIEAGQLTLTLEDYALADVVQSVVSATEGLATTKGLKLTADIAPGLPTGHGDARRLSQVLLNLVGNAVKFTDAGEVAIRAAAEGGNFVLTVSDTGPGIAPGDHDKIFGEFQQVDNSNTRKKGGTGLGLAISKRMVEMHGGAISVDSELGNGATFRVVLPIRVEDLPGDLPEELAGELMGAA